MAVDKEANSLSRVYSYYSYHLNVDPLSRREHRDTKAGKYTEPIIYRTSSVIQDEA